MLARRKKFNILLEFLHLQQQAILLTAFQHQSDA